MELVFGGCSLLIHMSAEMLFKIIRVGDTFNYQTAHSCVNLSMTQFVQPQHVLKYGSKFILGNTPLSDSGCMPINWLDA
jgi:hypothetical protein